MIELNCFEFYKNYIFQKRGATSDVEYVWLMWTCITNLHQHVTKDIWERIYNLMKYYNSINLKLAKQLTYNTSKLI
jgi:hypothetical protein